MANRGVAKIITRFREPPGPPPHFIRQLRLHRGFTQTRLAETLGVTHGAMAQLEHGLTSCTQPILEAIAKVLECTPADLLGRNPTTDV